MRSKVITE